MTHIVYLSLGSNIGKREGYLRAAIAQLQREERLIAVSCFYETEPVEFTDQAWFLNCAVKIETSKTPVELMAEILSIEHQMGRRRIQMKGPRTIDIDILLFGDMVVNIPDLTIPHPAMANRRFVLEPLAEIAAEVRHPLLNKSVKELLEELPAGQVVRQVSVQNQGPTHSSKIV